MWADGPAARERFFGAEGRGAAGRGAGAAPVGPVRERDRAVEGQWEHGHLPGGDLRKRVTEWVEEIKESERQGTKRREDWAPGDGKGIAW